MLLQKQKINRECLGELYVAQDAYNEWYDLYNDRLVYLKWGDLEDYD